MEKLEDENKNLPQGEQEENKGTNGEKEEEVD